ncbi:putative bifunctional diguanylate cyclase/phosphodiesterase [Thiohalobacter sp.]|uniref:putative bifunctional diguanylate cyclase/phosphodiesterase n=1 Tax=Thiohalobacter sp. TaxID=2025948 RepID=UPI00260CA43B|nr:EAL domain-containing protein [Thiohalobacter sp.]
MPTTDPEHLAALERALAEREREIELLKETAFAVGSELHLQPVLDLIAQRARQLINAETVLIPILDRACQQYTYRAGAGANVAEIVGESLPLDFGVCGWVWRHQKPWWRGTLASLSPEERNRWEKEAGTLIMVPLVGRHHFLGGLAGMNKQGGGDFSRRDLDLLTLFASQAAIAIENAMAYQDLEEARKAAEDFQEELFQTNKRLVAVNQELEYLSLYDTLTGLPNRSLFRDRVRQQLLNTQRDTGHFAVVLLDLDRFKAINETLGHEVGDQLLKQVSTRLAGELRTTDTVARLGGDEFAVLLPQADEAAARVVAEQLLRALDPPFTVDHQQLAVGASAGIAIYPQHGDDLSQLLRHADTAMYMAKQEHAGVAVYDPSQDDLSVRQLSLMADLKSALAGNQFQLHFQPKVDLCRERVVGVEALARWQHPEQGMVPPDRFIGALEETGLMHAFSHWALDTALAQLASWRDRGWELSMAVNLSVKNLLEADFAQRLEMLLEKWQIRGGLVLEITEDLFLSDYDHLNSVLTRICDLGVTLSIDDFGTGHSSLSRLKKLPVGELKIDRSFVMDMVNDSDDATIVRSTVELAHNLGLVVVAEGVEDEEALSRLRTLGCDMAQGYHISRPLSAGDLDQFLAESPWPVVGLTRAFA